MGFDRAELDERVALGANGFSGLRRVDVRDEWTVEYREADEDWKVATLAQRVTFLEALMDCRELEADGCQARMNFVGND